MTIRAGRGTFGVYPMATPRTPTAKMSYCSSTKKKSESLRAPGIVASILVVLLILCCARTASPPEKALQQEQELQITLGGFIADHPEGGALDGVCGLTDYTRNEISCDIYNGLSHWKLTQVTIIVTWYPYEDGDRRDYRLPASLAPLTTETFRLGLQLRPDDTLGGHRIQHWGWTYGPVRGYRVN